jgi:CHRD domain
MKRFVLAAVLCIAAIALAATALAGGGNGGSRFSAKLNGYGEVPPEATVATGSLRLRIVGDVIHFRLHYEGIEASEGSTTAAHIHFGQKRVNGGVIAFLCGGSEAACTPTEGTFQGEIHPNEIVGPSGQGIQPGEMAKALRAIRNEITYANVHTSVSPAGLIRGEIRGGGGDHDD